MGATLLVSAGLVISSKARQAQTDVWSYLLHPVRNLGTVQIGDPQSVKTFGLRFHRHKGNPSRTRKTHILYASVLGPIQSETSWNFQMLGSQRWGPNTQLHGLMFNDPTLDVSFVAADNIQHGFVSIGESPKEQMSTINLWRPDILSDDAPGLPYPLEIANSHSFESAVFTHVDFEETNFVATGQIATASNQEQPTFWVSSVLKPSKPIVSHPLTVESPVLETALRPYYQDLLTVHEDDSVVLWDVTTGERIRSFAYQRRASSTGDRSTQVLFNERIGDLIALANTSDIHIWQAETAQLIRTIPLKDQTLRNESDESIQTQSVSLAIDQDGTLVASNAGQSDKIYIWDIQTGELQRVIQSVLSPDFLAFDPNGRQLAVATASGKVTVWQLPERF